MKNLKFVALFIVCLSFTSTLLAQNESSYSSKKLSRIVHKTLEKNPYQDITTSHIFLESNRIRAKDYYPFIDLYTLSFPVHIKEKDGTLVAYTCHLSKYRSMKWNRISFEEVPISEPIAAKK